MQPLLIPKHVTVEVSSSDVGTELGTNLFGLIDVEIDRRERESNEKWVMVGGEFVSWAHKRNEHDQVLFLSDRQVEFKLEFQVQDQTSRLSSALK